MPLKVACIGEAMVELSLDTDQPDTARIGFAGDTLNTAIYLKRAAPEIEVHYVTRLGRDSFSDQMLEFIRSEGIATDLIGRSDSRSAGLYAISTDAAGERSFAYWRDRSAARELFSSPPPDLSALAGFDLLYLSAITLAILDPAARTALFDWLSGYRKAGGKVAFDSNYRPKLWPDRQTARAEIGRFWKITDIALPSVDDEMAIFGERDEDQVASRFRTYAPETGALKRGANGPFSLGDIDVGQAYPAASKIVDTTAAGDSFNAGYLAAWLTGKGQKAALRAGHDLAVRVLGVRGAILPREG